MSSQSLTQSDDLPPTENTSASEPPAKWELPVDFESFNTYINHGCRLNSQNYPIYPAGNTVFVEAPEDTITNFGTVGFTKTTGKEKRGQGTWEILRVYCLGALICTIDSCQWYGSPHWPRCDSGLLGHCKGAAGRCPGEVVWHPCEGTALRFDFHIPTGWGLLRHRGIHHHPWPEAKKPDKLARETLKAEVAKNPSSGAFKLKMGHAISLDDPIQNVTDIHGSFVNADRLRYYRRLVLRELGIVPDKLGAGVGDKFIMDMFQWNRRGLLVISSGFQEEDKHFTFQSKWMAERLLAQDENNEVYQGGLISDVTYQFFEHGYLLTTSMFCEQTAQWIPVQLSWIRGLSANYYKIHFSVLLRQMVRHDITTLERDIMLRQVVDFSLAQVEGFKAALREVFGITDPVKLEKMVKGCHQHFWAQVSRIMRQTSIISADQDKSFQFKCMDLLEVTGEGEPNHEDKLDELRRLFPKAKRWLDWWTMADIQSMLFPSRRRMLDDYPDGDDGLPDTTNAIESMHRVYYMISSGKKCLMVGMVELYAYVKVLEEEFHAVMCGISVEYGSQSKMQVNVSQSIGWASPTKRKFVNDGRPPDTTKGLLDGPDPSARRKSLGRPKNSPNVDRNPYTTYQSYSRSEEAHLTNRCWVSAAMESLFALYNHLWLCNATSKGATLFHQLVNHFGSRTTFQLTKNGRIRTVLTNGQSKLFKLCNEKHQANFVSGSFASCDLFLELLLDPKRNPTKALTGLFEVEEHRTFSCDSASTSGPCLPAQTQSLTKITLYKSMFDENELEYGQVQELIDLWTSTGMLKSPGLACKCAPKATSAIAKAKPGPKSAKHRQPLPEREPSVTIVPLSSFSPEVNRYVSENSRLAFKDDQPPQHLYFFSEAASLTDKTVRDCYMGSLNWPSKLVVAGHPYTLFSCGFWINNHYWCKVLRSGEGGVTGVWLHDDAQNDGIARLVNKDTSSIGGCQPGTSWVFYTRTWTASEDQYVRNAISKISKDNPNAEGDTPFVHLAKLIAGTPVVGGDFLANQQSDINELTSKRQQVVEDRDDDEMENYDSDKLQGRAQDSQVPLEEPPAPARPIKLTLKVSPPAASATITVSPAPPLTQPKASIAVKGCKGKAHANLNAPIGQAQNITGNTLDGRRRSTRLSAA
ncbi:hypothetical protein PSTG_17523 [Puccinia striiformis f. sp. tritici PST-78]|uniref:GCM domain-containing protein n=1 Tax=Puccinia striiformis f. sp. tritici PST-78 TaxID=1165861 RepID=A0A0L0UQ23_9BASI|nr:hypothetical protein PSTG_17523 [Puccinia striiformis f. sp. tritici PST-78]